MHPAGSGVFHSAPGLHVGILLRVNPAADGPTSTPPADIEAGGALIGLQGLGQSE